MVGDGTLSMDMVDFGLGLELHRCSADSCGDGGVGGEVGTSSASSDETTSKTDSTFSEMTSKLDTLIEVRLEWNLGTAAGVLLPLRVSLLTSSIFHRSSGGVVTSS